MRSRRQPACGPGAWPRGCAPPCLHVPGCCSLRCTAARARKAQRACAHPLWVGPDHRKARHRDTGVEQVFRELFEELCEEYLQQHGGQEAIEGSRTPDARRACTCLALRTPSAPLGVHSCCSALAAGLTHRPRVLLQTTRPRRSWRAESSPSTTSLLSLCLLAPFSVRA